APTLIGQAIQLRDSALGQRRAGDWEGAAELADNARLTAERALEAALKQRDATAEALLSDRDGWVEGQRPQDLVWGDRPLNTVLIEQEKVRTLSRSTAQITFRDDSRLRLNANSQALIQRLRADPLSRTEEAKVSLVAGDVYALLAGRSQRRQFELEVPEVETRIESTNFWARHDASGSKFANYDDRTLEVAARGESVVLGRNEGTVVRRGEAPSDKIDVLPPPALVAPQDDAVAFNADVDLQWAPVASAAGYWLEVAGDPAFRQMTLSRWGLKDAGFAADGLDIGAYYWRVAALDKFGLPGARSDVRRFNVRADTVPPFVSIAEPAEGAIVRRGPVRVAGASEPGVTLTLGGGGGPVAVGPDGAFAASVDPKPGVNEVVVEARDRAGNATRRSRSFIFMPDERAAVIFDDGIPRLGPRHFVTERDVISLAGKAAPSAQVHIRAAAADGGAARASAYTDAEGRFRVNVPLRAETEEFELQVVTPSGFETADRFAVSSDERPPAVELDEPPPAVTAVEWLQLRGRAAGATELLLNGRPVPAADDVFDETVTLHPGANEIEMVATDLVGNVRVERWQVVLDQEPPLLVRQSLS
ncbi:MAG TPA: FecR domain-containing protein, partial [Geminicoccaceae bacterium]|nr:FecR domain-containing protein [Geminicoccaceae bacterium]